MPEIVTYKVRAEIEYTVVSVVGFGAATQCAEEKIVPVVKPDKSGDLNGSYVHAARIVSIETSRD